MYNSKIKAKKVNFIKIGLIRLYLLVSFIFNMANIVIGQHYTIIASKTSEGSLSQNYLSLGEHFIIDSSKMIQTTVPKPSCEKLMQSPNPGFETEFILSDEKAHHAKLTEVHILESNFACLLDDNQSLQPYNFERGAQFQGIIDDDTSSLMTLNVSNQQIHGILIASLQEQYTLHSENNADETTLFIQALKIKDIEIPGCHTNDWDHYLASETGLATRTRESCKRTQISVRADYELYLKFGKNPQVLGNYIVGLFNQVNALYRREDIQITLSEIIINTLPDGFTHTSANADLNTLKTKYKNFKGNIQLCLSGYSNKGKATLGGVAYINALCLKSYAFAFANIDGNYKSFQEYSYDVFLAAHELGHVFGSRHTHACVWGPNKNQALDNCSLTEGGCKPGPKPFKGSIMSYCHLSGNPGIDLLIGFGQEPGDLIRQNVNNSNCLVSYTPGNNGITKSDQHITANVECSDGLTSYYYFDNNTVDESDDILIASIQKNKQNIGNINNGSLNISAHTTKSFGKGTCNSFPVNYSATDIISANRYWEIKSNAVLTTDVKIRLYANNFDLIDLKSKEPKLTPEMLQLVVAQNPGDANPDKRQVSLNKMNTNVYSNGQNLALKQWSIIKSPDGSFSLDFQTKTLNNYGLIYSKDIKFNDAHSRTHQSSSPNAYVFSSPQQQNELYLNFFNPSDASLQMAIHVTNMGGQSVYNFSTMVLPGTNTIPVPTENLTNGIYLIHTQTEIENDCFKFSIAR